MTTYYGKNKSSAIIYHNSLNKSTKSQVLSLDISSTPSQTYTVYSPDVCAIGFITSQVNVTLPMKIVAGGVSLYLPIKLTFKGSLFPTANKCAIYLHNERSNISIREEFECCVSDCNWGTYHDGARYSNCINKDLYVKKCFEINEYWVEFIDFYVFAVFAPQSQPLFYWLVNITTFGKCVRYGDINNCFHR